MRTWPNPKTSILIPIFCRERLLQLGLESLSLQRTKYPFEVIVLNDGLQDRTEAICKSFESSLNMKYIFTGQRNLETNEPMWRCPGFALNVGSKIATGEIIIITCPEIIHLQNDLVNRITKTVITNPKALAIPQGLDDQKNTVTAYLETNKLLGAKELPSITNIEALHLQGLNTNIPFFMGVNKDIFTSIGGYDEDFKGICFDDNDIVDRLQAYGCIYQSVDSTIVHLYHKRGAAKGPNYHQRFVFNQKLYNSRKQTIKRNVDREWGKLEQDFFSNTSTKPWGLQKIPKIAHFYWGNEILPFLRYLALYSFRKCNPDWEIKLHIPLKPYKDSILDCHGKTTVLEGINYFNQLNKLNIQVIPESFDFLNQYINVDVQAKKDYSRKEVYKSDFLRWHLLATEGGLWSDLDIIYFRPMTELDLNTDATSDCDTVISLHPKYGHSVGFMLSCPDNLYYKHIYTMALEAFNPKAYQSIGVDILNKPFPTADAVMKRFQNLAVYNTDITTVYAYDATTIDKIYFSLDMSRYTSKSLGLHWYAGHPYAVKAQNEVTEENYQIFSNVLGQTIKRVFIYDKE